MIKTTQPWLKKSDKLDMTNKKTKLDKYEIVSEKRFFFKTKLTLKYLLQDIEQKYAKCSIKKELLDQIDMEGSVEDESFVQKLMVNIYPPLTFDKNILAAFTPFSLEPFYYSKQFKEIFMNDKGKFDGRIFLQDTTHIDYLVKVAALAILTEHYGVEIKASKGSISYANREIENRFIQYYSFVWDNSYCRVIKLNKNHSLTELEINNLLENFENTEMILSLLPIEDFLFEGIHLANINNITKDVILSGFKKKLIETQNLFTLDNYLYKQGSLRVLLNNPDLDLSISIKRDDIIFKIDKETKYKNDNLYMDAQRINYNDISGSFICYTYASNKPSIVNDIRKVNKITTYEQNLIDQGYKSWFISPILNLDKTIGHLELYSTKINAFNTFELNSIQEVFPLYGIVLGRHLDLLDQAVETVLKDKCTAIHPSSEWLFKEVAFDYLYGTSNSNQSFKELPEINFKDVYPLFAASDIKDSSTNRNQCIQLDLLEQVSLIQEIIELSQKEVFLPLVDMLQKDLESMHKGISSKLLAGDEIRVLQFIKNRIAPIFENISRNNLDLKRHISDYKEKLDPKLGIIYNQRKKYDESVLGINNALSGYLEVEQLKIQQIFPHHFDKQQTDGIDHNIYFGKSMVEDSETYNPIYVKNLRLWQLMVMCGSAQVCEQIKEKLSFPLEVRHIIAVQGNPLAIKFAYDEKKLNVDGAYNTRYEIMKKRIDKAIIKGTDERISKVSHIAIVYSQDQEANEYREYINYLKKLDLVTGETQDYILDDLQGIHGLRALRVKVNIGFMSMDVLQYINNYNPKLKKAA